MSATAAAPDATTNRKVLIADDDPAVVRALSVRCKKLGLEVETAENGLQAILKASRNPPRLLILDINMPEADGFRVCEWLLDPQRPPDRRGDADRPQRFRHAVPLRFLRRVLRAEESGDLGHDQVDHGRDPRD